MTLADGKKFEYYKGFPLIEGQIMTFPSFQMTYLGEIPGLPYPNDAKRRMGAIKNFEIQANGDSQQIRWSSGTGEISPVAFRVGNARYFLAPFLPPGLDASEQAVPDPWFVYPEVPSTDLELKTPSLFIAKLESLQALAEKAPLSFGLAKIDAQDRWNKFSITSLRWVGAQLQTGYTYTYDMNRRHWLLPEGFYKVRGEGFPDSQEVYFQVRVQGQSSVVLQARSQDQVEASPIEKQKLWVKKTRNPAEFGKPVVLETSSVAAFPMDFVLGLDRFEDQLIGYYICFELPFEWSSFSRCTTIPTKEFVNEKNQKNFKIVFSRKQRNFVVEIINAAPLTVIVTVESF